MGLVIMIPSSESVVAIVTEQGLQPRVFDVTVAEQDLSFPLMPYMRPDGAARRTPLTRPA
jgi:hypothetical protein